MNAQRDIYVTFDLWETLIVDRPELDFTRNSMRCEGLHKALLRLGINLSLEDLRSGYEKSAHHLQAVWRRNEHIPTTEQIRLILREASESKVDLPDDLHSAEMLQRAYVDPIFDAPPELNRDAVQTLEGMRKRAKKLGLISNTGRSPGTALRQLIDRYEILRFFDVTIFSDEVGWRKPDRRIFEAAATKLGTNLIRIVHIGDDPEADAWGAKQAGMRAVLLDYSVPEGFKRQPSSLFALGRADRRVKDSEINPDVRISSLREALDFVDSLE